MVTISTGLPCSTMRNFSSSVVPPAVNSISTVDLYSLAFCSSQCPTSVLNWANASALPPAAAAWREPASPASNTAAIRILAAFFIVSLPSKKYLSLLQLPRTNGKRMRCWRLVRLLSKSLRREPHDHAKQHAGKHDVEEQRHPGFQNQK